MSTQWEAVIGLEIHTQLLTNSKIFSGSSTEYGAAPNTQACLIDLGFPGVLPVLNQEVVKMAVKLGLAINAEIPEFSVFERKNYFYPDLPKGYQISQYHKPIVKNGYIDIELANQTKKRIQISHAHMEEDAGKSLHEDFHGSTGIDLNRAGTPLIEIVSAPDLRSAEEAVTYMKAIHELVTTLEICDGNMQEGSFRCDANVSVRPIGQEKLGTRTEIKNVNSFKFVEKAIEFEIERQISVLENGGTITQETRLYDEKQHQTRAMRSKEQAHDYRYFPDPDLLPITISPEFLESVRQTMPELPAARRARFQSDYELSDYDAYILVASRSLADYFETVVKAAHCSAKLAANWVTGELQAKLNAEGVTPTDSKISAETLATLLKRIEDKTISTKIAKSLFDTMWETPGNVDELISSQGLQQVTDTGALEKIIDEIIKANPAQVEQFKSGKDKVFGFFVGQVMKATQGKGNPEQINEILKNKLK